ASYTAYVLSNPIQTLAGTLSDDSPLGIRGKHRQVLIPPLGQFAMLHKLQLISELRVLLRVIPEHPCPLRVQVVSTFSDAFAEVLTYSFGYEKLGVFGPAVEAFRQTNFFFSERLAMSFAGV